MHINRVKSLAWGVKKIAFIVSIALVFALVFPALAEKWNRQIPLKVYLSEQSRKSLVRRQVEERFQRPFHQFSKEQYATFMKGLNLDHDEDLFQWSQVTGVPVVALRKTSFFFRMNLHLMDDIDAAEHVKRQTAYMYETAYDEQTGNIDLRDESGTSLKLRVLAGDLLMPVGRVGRYWHYRNFVDTRIKYEVIGPYLIRFSDLPYRNALGDWIREIPLNIVKAYRGKAIYLTNIQGRSFATTMPVSNMNYKVYVGLTTGVWVEMRRDGDKGTRNNFIHELGHVVDYVVLQGGYGSFRDYHQFPGFRKLLMEKEKVFGAKDDKVPNTPFGYISRYARTNAQESYAVHFRVFITDRESFRVMAEKQAAEGHAELKSKYQFMEKMMEKTPTTMIPLSRAFLEKEAIDKKN